VSAQRRVVEVVGSEAARTRRIVEVICVEPGCNRLAERHGHCDEHRRTVVVLAARASPRVRIVRRWL
jgi:hypothetical protein